MSKKINFLKGEERRPHDQMKTHKKHEELSKLEDMSLEELLNVPYHDGRLDDLTDEDKSLLLEVKVLRAKAFKKRHYSTLTSILLLVFTVVISLVVTSLLVAAIILVVAVIIWLPTMFKSNDSMRGG